MSKGDLWPQRVVWGFQQHLPSQSIPAGLLLPVLRPSSPVPTWKAMAWQASQRRDSGMWGESRSSALSRGAGMERAGAAGGSPHIPSPPVPASRLRTSHSSAGRILLQCDGAGGRCRADINPQALMHA